MLLLLCWQVVVVLLDKNQQLTSVVAVAVAPAEIKLLLDKVVEEHKLRVVLEDLVMLEMETLEVNY
tara:strand:- start:90 stop:287 length:198 start_codon:yes stop_codon:yes gene_type:complete